MRNLRESPTHRQRRIASLCDQIDRAVVQLGHQVSLCGSWEAVPHQVARQYRYLLHESSLARARAASDDHR